MFRRHAALLAILIGSSLAIGPLTAAAQAKSRPTAKPGPATPSSRETACRKGVQAFYDWYVPRLMKEVHVTAMEQAFRARPRSFTPELRRALLEDLEAGKKSRDEIVSLDFEPFVNSQDPAAKYVAKRVTRAGQGCRVEVHAVVGAKASERPDVIAEVELRGGHWTFVNFHYPGADAKDPGTDLLKLLRQLKEDRRRK